VTILRLRKPPVPTAKQIRPKVKLLQVIGFCLALSIKFSLEDYKFLRVLGVSNTKIYLKSGENREMMDN
jgi:hypothetical protein